MECKQSTVLILAGGLIHSKPWLELQRCINELQSRTQSPQALWPAVGRQERLWGTGILLPQDFCSETMQTATRQPIKKFKFFEFSRVSPGDQPPAKEPEDSGYKIERAGEGISYSEGLQGGNREG